MQSKAVERPTRAESERMDRIAELGCVCCWQRDRLRLAEVNHMLEGGKRIRHGEHGTEHRYTFGLCPWHHRSVLPDGWDANKATVLLGPPMGGTHGRGREFKATFGDQWELLELQDKLLECDERERYLVVADYVRRRRSSPVCSGASSATPVVDVG